MNYESLHVHIYASNEESGVSINRDTEFLIEN